MTLKSNCKDLTSYGFLVAFANDETINKAELHMLERIALGDGIVDDKEKQVLRNLFARINPEHLSKKVEAEIRRFRADYDI